VRVVRALRLTLATWFGSGYAPVASGTVGTLATVPLVLLLGLAESTALYVGVTAVVIVAGTWASWNAEEVFGRPDPGPVVVDEAAGFLVTMAFLPLGAGPLVAGFLLFRAADVIKPFPARRFEALPRGVGIMADDLMAGLYANLLLRAGLYLLER
jgi:phosphatidylglycerophosphatase A